MKSRTHLMSCLALLTCAHMASAQEPAVPEESRQEAAANIEAALTRELQLHDRDAIPQEPALPSIGLEDHVLDPAGQSIGQVDPGRGEEAGVDLAALEARFGADADFRVFRGSEQEAVINDRRGRHALQQGQVLAIEPNDANPIETVAGGRQTIASSTRLFVLDRNGKQRELSLFHASEGLSWNAEKARFIGDLLVGILDRQDASSSSPLDQVSIPVQLLAANNALDRDNLTFDHIGQPYEKVTVEAAFPENPFKVKLISPVDPKLPVAKLPVRKPILNLVAPNRLKGLGIGADEVVIQPDNTRLRPGEHIALDLDQGWLSQKPVVVGDDRTASVRIRSDWVGNATLKLAPSAVYQAEEVRIEYTWPVRFLLSSLLGAMLGALVYVYRLKRKAVRSGAGLWFDWSIGTLVGFIAPLMAYAGMKLPNWVPISEALTGEVVPFVIAFICATAGTALVDLTTGSRSAPAGG